MTDDLRRFAAALDGTYALGDELGGGAMARVFAATECALGRPVVLKVLTAEFESRGALARFRREVRVAATLQHPHIVPLLHAGVAGGLLYYTMPLVAGESLRARLAREGAMDVARGARVLHDVAEALAHAHACGVVHRDIKPGNILLCGDDALVIDFGIAKAFAAAGLDSHPDAPAGERPADAAGPHGTDAVVVLGSAAYLSPEQAAGDAVDHRADLYALGCVAYELFSGAPPFAGRHGRALLAAQMFDAPEPLARVCPTLPPALAALITGCLAKQPDDRPQRAADLLPTLADSRVAQRRMEADVPAPAGVTVGRVPRRPRVVPARALVPVAAALVTLAAFGAAGPVPGTPRATTAARPNARSIVIRPFRVLAPDAALAFLDRGMADLLAARIGPALAIVERATPARVPDAARDDARVITGDVIGDSRRLAITASLVGGPNGRAQPASAAGPLDSLPAVADRLSNELLALAAGEITERAALLASEPPGALREYLVGRARQRQGAWDNANDHFLAAVQADSTFAQAALQLASTSTSTRTRRLGYDALALAWRHRDRLGPRDQALAAARGATFPPLGAPVVELVRLSERAVDVAPDEPEAWRWLGAVLYRWGAAGDVPNADARTAAAYERAALLDSTHLARNLMSVGIYAMRGDSTALRRAIATGLASDTTAPDHALYAWCAGVLLGDRAHHEFARRRIVPAGISDWVPVVSLAVDIGAGFDDADRVIRVLGRSAATTEERSAALMTARKLYLARGQPSRAAQAYADLLPVRGGDDPVALRFAGEAALDAAFGGGDSVLGRRARQALADAFAPGTSPDRLARGRNAAALYDLAHGDARTARAVLASTRRSTPPAVVNPVVVDEVAALDAWVAVEERRPDARTRVARLDSVLHASPPYEIEVPNVVASDLWERLGDRPRALEASRRRTRWMFSSHYQAPMLRREARLAVATGDTAGAVRAYRQYVRLRADAEPRLRPELDAVRAALAQLEHARGTR